MVKVKEKKLIIIEIDDDNKLKLSFQNLLNFEVLGALITSFEMFKKEINENSTKEEV